MSAILFLDLEDTLIDNWRHDRQLRTHTLALLRTAIDNRNMQSERKYRSDSVRRTAYFHQADLEKRFGITADQYERILFKHHLDNEPSVPPFVGLGLFSYAVRLPEDLELFKNELQGPIEEALGLKFDPAYTVTCNQISDYIEKRNDVALPYVSDFHAYCRDKWSTFVQYVPSILKEKHNHAYLYDDVIGDMDCVLRSRSLCLSGRTAMAYPYYRDLDLAAIVENPQYVPNFSFTRVVNDEDERMNFEEVLTKHFVQSARKWSPKIPALPDGVVVKAYGGGGWGKDVGGSNVVQLKPKVKPKKPQWLKRLRAALVNNGFIAE